MKPTLATLALLGVLGGLAALSGALDPILDRLTSDFFRGISVDGDDR